MQPRVMIVGLGSLGGVVLELLAREPAIAEIVVASRNAAGAEARCNLARVGAAAQGFAPSIRFVQTDLADTSRTAEMLAREVPDLVLCTASLQTWWLAELLPPAAAPLSRARFGAWLPVHLALAIRFMEAVRAAAYRGHTLVASFPDVVNVVLGRMGMAPTCGVGNLDEIVPKVRLLAAGRAGVSPRAVRVLLVAHHALEPFVFGDPKRDAPPYWIRVEANGRDVTADVDAASLLFARYPLPPGPAWHFLTAGSTVRLVRALVTDDGGLLHVPAPAGLPGGYPVVASRAGVQRLPLPGLSPDEAVAINERSHPFDGIARIDETGTVYFADKDARVMREVLGYNVGPLKPQEAAASANELLARFREYAAGHGVDLASAAATLPHAL